MTGIATDTSGMGVGTVSEQQDNWTAGVRRECCQQLT
jgi:hypothetical protein